MFENFCEVWAVKACGVEGGTSCSYHEAKLLEAWTAVHGREKRSNLRGNYEACLPQSNVSNVSISAVHPPRRDCSQCWKGDGLDMFLAFVMLYSNMCFGRVMSMSTIWHQIYF